MLRRLAPRSARPLAVVACCVFLLWTARPGAVSFSNPAAITIPTVGDATPYPSPIVVSGVTGTISSMTVTLHGFTHTFPDDVGVVLVAPGGQALLILDGIGDAGGVTGLDFTISDAAGAYFPNTDTLASGTFRPTSYYTGDSFPAPGPGTAYGNPGAPPNVGTATLDSTFGGRSPNGTWNLFVTDFVARDGGSISGGWSLDFTTNGTRAPADFDGDGRTDPSVARNTGGGASGAMTWYTQQSTAGLGVLQWGIASDSFVPRDFDGDGKADIAVWRASGTPGATAFYIHQSSNGALRTQAWGAPGDNPTIVSDFDGDGKDDVAVYRPGASPGLPSYWYILRSSTSSYQSVQWGQNGDRPATGDFDGDGKADEVVQRNVGGQGVLYINLSSGGFQSVAWGNPSDAVAIGDYDGDGIDDAAVVRLAGGQLFWYIRSSAGGYALLSYSWGIGGDYATPGDYDGDGKIDVAVWRQSPTPGASAFYIRQSHDGSLLVKPWGQITDYPVANFNVH